eukprot:CAMPEP_0197600154 /NCGR_PEP_ID=MMETSP1326-20131121/32742_1 /TAXON_ID=1155430 /ORGANISM="Genus nov. species nov., Strain RCC2288" /LENGTH=202 /DNA_ID=CAMNT_0043167215 /DNA_START=39 /DNA_END=647 /DNA_ORIENTATION=+
MAATLLSPTFTTATAQLRAQPRAQRARVAVAAAGAAGAGEQHVEVNKLSQKQQMAQMRREVQLRSMEPSVANVLNTVIELAGQEFGLAGVKFNEVMDKVNECYVFTPCAYTSGAGTPEEVVNAAGVNSGSLKTYYFAHLHGLDEASTLRLFCEHYSDTVADPGGTSHGNIRSFMKHGWEGIAFTGEPLRLRDGSEPSQIDSI